ncbi:predicted protein, partial [Nematostella vectensis]
MDLGGETNASTAENTPRVLVTGASGFIACHVVKQLLEEGKFIVRGTVRDLSVDKKVQPLRNLCPDSKYPLEIVEADLMDEVCWERAAKDCQYVLHMASPFPASNPKLESDIIEPAVEGTRSVLKACAKCGVKRVVLTSSIAAVSFGHDDSRVLTEEDWSIESECFPYAKSKLLAEKEAWKLVEGLQGDEKFELVVINPGLVYGPVLQGSNCTSMEIPCRLLERQMLMVPKYNLGIVDVRDVAKAHISAITAPNAPGNRYIAVTGNMWVHETARILNDEFRPQGYKVPTMVAPKLGLFAVALFDSSVRMILPEVGKCVTFSNKKIKEDLGFAPRELKDTVIDMAYSMIEQGFVKKTPKY